MDGIGTGMSMGWERGGDNDEDGIEKGMRM